MENLLQKGWLSNHFSFLFFSFFMNCYFFNRRRPSPLLPALPPPSTPPVKSDDVSGSLLSLFFGITFLLLHFNWDCVL